MFLLFLSWDYLGVLSFFLVLFYGNFERVNGSQITVLMNRLGDFFIFIFFLIVTFYLNEFIVNLSYFLLLMRITKRAQFPFRGWLPKAIRAPTPVSSLVHRRTLVTAGLFVLFIFIDYNN